MLLQSQCSYKGQLLAVWIQMFEELKSKIAFQNVQKIKKTQLYIEQGQAQSLSDSSSSDGELTERLQVFKMLIEDRPTRKAAFLRSARFSHTKAHQTARTAHLIQQQSAIQRQIHQKELRFTLEQHQSEKKALSTEIQKLKCAIQRHVREEAIVNRLKKENSHLQELQSRTQQVSQILQTENTTLKKEVYRLRTVVKQKEENQAALKAQKHLQSQSQTRLKEQVIAFTTERALEGERKKQMEALIYKLKSQNEQLVRERERFKMQTDLEKTQLSQKFMLQILKSEDQSKQLRKRNQKLQQSFIQHLTQTSANLQQTLKAAPEKINRNSTLYLQESPIKRRSHSRKSPKVVHQEQDPEKGAEKECSCSGQVAKLKHKLQLANAKIVELLYEKCHNYGKKMKK